jgi:hypothetical protein
MFDSTKGTLVDRIPIHPKETNFDGGRVWGGVALDKNKGIVLLTLEILSLQYMELIGEEKTKDLQV